MKPMKVTSAIVIVTAALAIGVGAISAMSAPDAPAAPDIPGRPVEAIMTAKLRSAQSVLEGLATEDYVAIRTHATRLSQLSQAAQWQVHKGAEYAKLSGDFRQAVDSMAAHAKEKDLDACTLDYVQMTLICVRCHKHVRKIGISELPQLELKADLALRP